MRKALFSSAIVLGLMFMAGVPSAFADSIDFTGLGGSWTWNGTTLSLTTGSLSIIGASGNPLSFLNSASSGPDMILSVGPGLTNGGSVDVVQSFYTIGTGGECSADCFLGSSTGSTFTGGSDPGSGGVLTMAFVSGTIDNQLLTDLASLGYFGGVVPEDGATGFLTLTLGSAVPCAPTGAAGIGDTAQPVSECGTIGSLDMTVTPVPEPGSLMLFGSGLLGMAGFLRRKLNKF